MLRDGVLQEKPGPSIATEFGVLLPGVHDERGTGASLADIISQRWVWGTVNFNAAAALAREQHADYFLDAIIEGRATGSYGPFPRCFTTATLACAGPARP